jgi:diguanylate cyclase (GGDEF)-like protein
VGDTRRVSASLALAVIDALDQPLLVSDAAGRLALVNAAARDLLGLADDLNVGLAALDCWLLADDSEQSSSAVGDALARTLAGEELARESLRLVAGARAPRWVQVSTKALWDTPPEIVGAVMTLLPINDASEDVEQLRNYASDMQMIDAVSSTLAELQDPGEAASVICTAALGTTGAIAAILWEHTAQGLVIRCSEGVLENAALTAISVASRAGATRAIAQANTVIERGHDRALAAEVVIDDRQPAELDTVWHEPLAVSNQITGVLSIVWAGSLADLERPGLLIRSLAEHAAAALERAALLLDLGDAARTDALTGVANRRVWAQSLDSALVRARREAQPLSLILIDIDHFKAYNDRLGHPQGDRLLQKAAQAWSQQLRTTDLLARVGGEEFAVLLPGCPIDAARLIAERVRAAMPDKETCSLGVVTWDGRASATELYATADSALYQAKRNGRNQVQTGQIHPPN